MKHAFIWVAVCGGDGVPEGRTAHQLVDVDDARVHLGLDRAVDSVRGDVQVCVGSIESYFELRSNCFVSFPSYFWPVIPVAAVFRGMHVMLFTSPVFWLGLVVVPITTLLIDIVFKV